MNSTPAAPRPLHCLSTLIVWAASLLAGAVAAAAPALSAADLKVVDRLGQPVAGALIEFVDQPVGAFGVLDLPVRRASNGNGVVSIADLARPPLGFRVVAAEPKDPSSTDWAIRFVHGQRIVDTTAGADLLGHKPRVYDMSKDVVCVVEETGRIEISIAGAKEGDQFHATFVDERPEPESHRNVAASGSFTGSSGSFRVPSGRGTLYLAEHGSIGAQLLNREGALMVSVAPGQTTKVVARFLDGPTARLIAPFDSIPFENIQALAPDGETVVAEFPFLASPLKVPSRFAVVASGARPPSALPAARYPKHFLRALDVPLQLPAYEDPDAVDVAKRFIERPPMELIFVIDPGAKDRLPEISDGWVRRARGGMALLSRALYGTRRDSGIARPATGEINIASAGSEPEWSAQVAVKDLDGRPLPFVEAFVAVRGAQLLRGITGPDGVLSITGLRSESASIGLVNSVADQAEVKRPAAGDESSSQGQIKAGQQIRVRGSWKRSPDNASVGDLLVLIPASQGARASRSQFTTHAVPLAFVDAAGNFDFGSVPRGSYTLRAGKANEAAIDLEGPEEPTGEQPATGSATLELSGTAETFSARLQRSQ